MSKHEPTVSSGEPTFSQAPVDWFDLWGIAKRGWAFVVFGVTLGLAGGVMMLSLMPPTYKANVRLVLEKSVNNYLRSANVIDGPTLGDDSWSQLHIISSEGVILPVIQKLNLAQDSEFGAPTPTAQSAESPSDILGTIKKFAGFPRNILSTLKEYAGLKAPASEQNRKDGGETAAYWAVTDHLKISWETQPTVINVAFESRDPQKAAMIANEVAESYINSTVESKRETARLAAKALQDRLSALRSQAANAERQVLEYRLANNVAAPGSVSSEQLNRLAAHISTAHLAMVDARARLDGAQQTGNMSLVPDNPTISRLREQYLDAEARAIEMEGRVGKGHAASLMLRKRLKELTIAMEAERKRIADSYSIEYELAKTRYDELTAVMNQFMNEESANSNVAARVRELQSAAETLRTLYNTMLQRVREEDRRDYHVMVRPDARVLVRAGVPSQTESSKKRLAVLAASSFLGLLFGTALMFLRHFPIGVFRTTDQVKSSLGRIAVIVPRIKKRRSVQLTDYALDLPYSRFAESMRLLWSLISAAQRENRENKIKVICVVSSVADEGKTTIATNLANQVSMHAAMRTLLIDADFHRQSLTKAIVPDAQQGLREALDHPENFADYVVKRERSGVDVLPCPLPERLPNAAQMLGSSNMEDLVNRARRSYDLVVIEAPPVGAVADCRLLAPFCDGFIFVAEWGKTSQRLVLETIEEVPNLWERILCVVLNKADPVALQSIEHYKGHRYHAYFLERPVKTKSEEPKPAA